MAGAPLGHRLVCMVYECVLLFGVLFLFGYAFSALTQFKGAAGLLRSAFQIYIGAVLALYFVWFWSDGRRTLPMKTLQLRLVDGHGLPLHWARASARFAAIALCALAALWMADAVHPGALSSVLLALAPAVFDRDRRALYDLAAGTRLVIDVPASADTA